MAGAIQAGDVVWTITGDTSKLNAAMVKSSKNMASMRKNFLNHSKAIGVGFTAIGGAIVGTLAGMATKFAKTGDEIQKMALRTGFSTEALSELGFAARRGGASLETIEKASKKMSQAIFEAGDEASKSSEKQGDAAAKLNAQLRKQEVALNKARTAGKGVEAAQEKLAATQAKINTLTAQGAKATGTYTDALSSIGLTYQDLASLNPEEQFLKVAFALADLEDHTVKVALAQELFGRAGTALLPMLADGSAGLQEMRDKARELGLVFDQESADSAAKFQDALENLKGASMGLVIQMGPIITETLVPFIEKIIEGAKAAGDWARENPALMSTLIKVGGAVGLLMLGLGPLLIVLPGIVAAFGFVSGAAGMLGAAGGIAVLTTMIGPLVLGVAIASAIVLTASAVIEFGKMREAARMEAESIARMSETVERTIESLEGLGIAIDRTTLAGKTESQQLDILIAVMRKQRTANLKAKEAAEQGADATKISGEANLIASGEVGQLATAEEWAARALGTTTEKLGDTKTATDLYREAMVSAQELQSDFIWGFRGIGTSADGAADAVKRLIDELNSIPSAQGGAGLGFAAGGVIPGFAAGGLIPKFAGGGMVGLGARIVKVGEKGPELAALPIGTHILSNAESKQAVREGVAGARTQNMTFTFGDIIVQDSNDPQQTAREIVDLIEVEMADRLEDARVTF